jgi:peptidoglycan hydrolase CwlO-like protein
MSQPTGQVPDELLQLAINAAPPGTKIGSDAHLRAILAAVMAEVQPELDAKDRKIAELQTALDAQYGELNETEYQRDKFHGALKVANANTERRDAKLKQAEGERDRMLPLLGGLGQDVKRLTEERDRLRAAVERVREMAEEAKRSAAENSAPGDMLWPLIGANRVLAALDQVPALRWLAEGQDQ